MIRFKDEATQNITSESEHTFYEVDADICSLNKEEEYVDLQFGNGGGVAFTVQRSCFKIVAENLPILNINP